MLPSIPEHGHIAPPLTIPDVDPVHVQTESVETKQTTYIHSFNSIENGNVSPVKEVYHFELNQKVKRTGVMLVGWGGNNGTTFTAGILANRFHLKWNTKDGPREPDFLGSVTQHSKVLIAHNTYISMKQLLPMLDPTGLVLGGWDINNANLAEATKRACVLDYDLQVKLQPYLENMVPLPSIFYPSFLAHDLSSRANHLIETRHKWQDLQMIRRDIQQFKQRHNLQQVIVMWTASTERSILSHDLSTWETMHNRIKQDDPCIAPSHIFACAALLERCPFINCAAQNTLVPALQQLAVRQQTFIVGNDLKTGQTKMKSMLLEMLLNSGIKPESIVSYNHLGNLDGCNLSETEQFRSKEQSKSDVVKSLTDIYPELYPEHKGPDHTVVIKYVPFVKDSKRAMDEYSSSIFMGGRHTLVLHNTCEDSLLAAPLMIDLLVLVELFSRVRFCKHGQPMQPFPPTLHMLSYWMKHSTSQIQCFQLSQQHRSLSNLLCAIAGLHIYDGISF